MLYKNKGMKSVYFFKSICVENLATNSMVFQIAVKSERESEILMVGQFFLPGGGNLRRSGFDHSNYFKSHKQLSVNTERQLKSKLALPVCQKSIKLKQK